MRRFKIIQRVFAIESGQLLQAAKTYPESFRDGLAIVTYNGIYSADERVGDSGEYRRFCDKMTGAGIPLEINLSVTLGHGDGCFIQDAPYPTMVDFDGTASRTSACPRSEVFCEHLRRLVTEYTVPGTKVFWLDDDFRLALHAPVRFGCFCPDCVARFDREYGLGYDRAGLADALAQDARINGEPVRKLWMQYNRQTLVDLTRIVADTLHSIDDSIILGFMQISPELVCYEMSDFKALTAAAANRDGEVWYRHGALFYGDRAPFGMVGKNAAIARLCALTEGRGVTNLTEEVTAPYTRREKSRRITLLEAVMNIGMAGADGVMDEAIKVNLREQLQQDGIVSWMSRSSDYLNKLYGLLEGKRQVGVYPYFSPDLWQYNDPCESIEQMGDLGARDWLDYFYLGIPFTFRPAGAKVLLASGYTLRAMPQEELAGWLRRGIYADGSSALEINRRFGTEATGTVLAEGTVPQDGVSERFTDHPLNGSAAGFLRYNIWQSSTLGAAALKPAGAEVLSYGMNAAESGLTGMTVHENPFGGRVGVTARGPWGADTLGQSKGEQIRNVMNWLCRDGLPVWAESIGKVGLSVWEDAAERVVFVYNTDFDPADVVLHCDAPCEAFLVKEDAEPLGSGDRLCLRGIEPWTAAVVVMKRLA